jgi:hypothetical protein
MKIKFKKINTKRNKDDHKKGHKEDRKEGAGKEEGGWGWSRQKAH